MFTRAHFFLRSCFQIFTLGIFVYQMKSAVQKYLSKPEIVERSETTLEDIESPLMYVCSDNQFNYSKAATHGYQSNTNFLGGKVTNSTTPSWMGNTTNNNLTPDMFLESLYSFNYSDLAVGNGKSEKVEVVTSGFCMKISNFSMNSIVEITTKNPLRVYILDPYRSTALRLERMLGHTLKLKKGPRGFSNSLYKISFELHDDTLHDGNICKDYSRAKGEFGDCFKQELEVNLKNLFGCLPIWFPTDSIKCSTSSMPHNETAHDYLSDLLDNIEMKTKCKPSCFKLKMNFMLESEITNFPKYTVFEVKFGEKVQIHKRAYSYDAFSLTVELGSALGLWVGLSALGLLDIFIEAFFKAKQSVENHLKHVSNTC